jgi:hypothetical protein
VDEWLWKEEEDEVMGGETNKPSGGDRKACL